MSTTTRKHPAKPPLSVEDLWAFERIGAPSLSPDGASLVCSVTRSSMEDNKNSSSLWLMATDGRAVPRRLTACGDKDGQPVWSPTGERIAFLAKREQEGRRDETPQLYLIAPDGGEAQRASDFAPGIESFKWLPDGRGILFSAWVWPELKGAAAQARRFKEFEERKESGYATSEAYYRYWDHNIPMGRVLHLLLLDLASGQVRDLFEGTELELPRDNGGASVYDISPDGRRVAFVFDPAAEPRLGNRLALGELEVRGRRLSRLVDEPAWDIGAPCYRGDGRALAITAAHVGKHHTALAQPALVEPGLGWKRLGGRGWDLEVDAPLRWSAAGDALLFAAEQRGRRHLWRLDVASGACRVVHEGGWVQGFDLAGELLALGCDSARHPVRLLARHGLEAEPLRLDRFNDELLAQRRLGDVREQLFTGALGEPVQMWLTFPPGFDARRRHGLLQVIHGGPFAAAGDTFSYRWNPHVLAARGHVVAQVNYHGSSGFGFAFRDSIMGRQGQLESQDIEAASDWLLAQPWADQHRLSATGGSYGGFMVAWMNGHVKPGRYRAYVCHAGVFDRIATFSADSYPQRPKDLKALYWQDMPKVLAQSPHAAAAAMQTPTLVIHGALDYRVPDCNGLAYYNTLKARGVDARLLWFPDENHWVLKPRNSRLWYREFLDWIERHEAAPARRPAKRKTG
ncbi:S9 family peptidase [Roseateles sp. DAIF2]|uniref:S9 family peptidase n=1 Tax=Roseateles sp. DAIF2 TaxID=2714952 RepID=UPI0018A3299A|nr:S9 family peptidase [Roseateles sp. DAIF2]QPF73767.1 S9 family peptidase [Roseateles sp. DAIF2]